MEGNFVQQSLHRALRIRQQQPPAVQDNTTPSVHSEMPCECCHSCECKKKKKKKKCPSLMGATGATGATGPVSSASTGATGATGPSGSSGAPGLNGATGASGASGLPGPVGATGVSGSPGLNGATGASGSPGSVGATGASGVSGSPGLVGATGPVGGTGVANLLFNLTTFVDVQFGNDTTGRLNDAAFPFRTIAAAQNAIVATGMPSANNVWCIQLAGGTTTEPTVPLRGWIDIHGSGQDNSFIRNGVNTSQLLSNESVVLSNVTIQNTDAAALQFNGVATNVGVKAHSVTFSITPQSGNPSYRSSVSITQPFALFDANLCTFAADYSHAANNSPMDTLIAIAAPSDGSSTNIRNCMFVNVAGASTTPYPPLVTSTPTAPTLSAVFVQNTGATTRFSLMLSNNVGVFDLTRTNALRSACYLALLHWLGMVQSNNDTMTFVIGTNDFNMVAGLFSVGTPPPPPLFMSVSRYNFSLTVTDTLPKFPVAQLNSQLNSLVSRAVSKEEPHATDDDMQNSLFRPQGTPPSLFLITDTFTDVFQTITSNNSSTGSTQSTQNVSVPNQQGTIDLSGNALPFNGIMTIQQGSSALPVVIPNTTIVGGNQTVTGTQSLGGQQRLATHIDNTTTTIVLVNPNDGIVFSDTRSFVLPVAVDIHLPTADDATIGRVVYVGGAVAVGNGCSVNLVSPSPINGVSSASITLVHDTPVFGHSMNLIAVANMGALIGWATISSTLPNF